MLFLHYIVFLVLRALLILIIIVKLRLTRLQELLFSPLIVAIASTFVFDALILFHEQGLFITRNFLFNKEHPFAYSHSLPIELQLLMIIQATFTWIAIIFNLLLSNSTSTNKGNNEDQEQEQGKEWVKMHITTFKPAIIGIAISALITCLLQHHGHQHSIDFSYMQVFQQGVMLIYVVMFIFALARWQWYNRHQQQNVSSATLIYCIVTLLQPVQSSVDSITIILSYLGPVIHSYEPLIMTSILPVLSFTIYFFEIQTPLIVVLLTLLRDGSHWGSNQVQSTSDEEKAIVSEKPLSTTLPSSII
ncbi:hypothetical protein BDC45DRAFT_505245, partial [Circinella umbellata]